MQAEVTMRWKRRAKGVGIDSDAVARRVQDCAAVILGVLPSSDLDQRLPLRCYCFSLYQLSLGEVLELVEEEFNVKIDDADWARSATPNWEDCTVDSIAEMVQRKLQRAGRPADLEVGGAKPASRGLSAAPEAPSAQARDDTSGVREAAQPPPTAHVATLQSMAKRLAGVGDRAAAIAALERALILLDDPGGQSANELLSSVVADLAHLYLDSGLFVRVQPPNVRQTLYERAVQLSVLGAERPNQAWAEALITLCQIERSAQRIVRAGTLCDQAVEVAMRSFGEGDPRTEPYLFSRGVLALESGDVARADHCFGRALDAVRALDALGSRSPVDLREASEALERQAMAYEAAREYDRAERLRGRSLRVRSAAAPRSREVAVAAHQFALHYFRRKDYKRARSILMEAIKIMVDITVPQARQNELRASDDSFTSFGPVVREAAIRDTETRAMLRELAVTWHETGPPLHTMETYEYVLSIYEEVHGPEHYELAHLLNNMGSFCVELRKYEKGTRLLERSLAILQRELNPNDPALAPVLHNLAGAYRSSGGRDGEAVALLER